MSHVLLGVVVAALAQSGYAIQDKPLPMSLAQSEEILHVHPFIAPIEGAIKSKLRELAFTERTEEENQKTMTDAIASSRDVMAKSVAESDGLLAQAQHYNDMAAATLKSLFASEKEGSFLQSHPSFLQSQPSAIPSEPSFVQSGMFGMRGGEFPTDLNQLTDDEVLKRMNERATEAKKKADSAKQAFLQAVHKLDTDRDALRKQSEVYRDQAAQLRLKVHSPLD